MKKFAYSLALSLTLTPVATFALEHDFGPVDMGSFYNSIPQMSPTARLGSLLKIETIPTTMNGVTAWKIAYISSDVQGRKTIATAVLAIPTGTAPKEGRPIVAWAHGTTGTAQNCGPSQLLNPAQPLNQYFMPTGNSWSDFGLPAMESFIKAGYAIVATDYQGLGGGGKHQYTVSATQARDVINSIRAAALFPEAHTGSKAVVYGWSQGGGATIATAGLADYLNTKGSARDGIEILGFVAMAPYDVAATLPEGKLDDAGSTKYLQDLGNSFGANVFNFTHYAQNIWGMVAAFPDLKLEDIFTADGAKIANEIFSRKCMHAASDTFDYAYGKNYKTLLRPDIQHASIWLDANKKGSVVPVKPMAPVISAITTSLFHLSWASCISNKCASLEPT
jgi:pimeloyl-ACP methyl ester carboxylesterase